MVMRLLTLFLVGALLALSLAPSVAMASELRDRLERVADERDTARTAFERAEKYGQFETRGDAAKVESQLDVADGLLSKAKRDIVKQRLHRASANIDAAEALVQKAHAATISVAAAEPQQTIDRDSPAFRSEGATLITVPSSE